MSRSFPSSVSDSASRGSRPGEALLQWLVPAGVALAGLAAGYLLSRDLRLAALPVGGFVFAVLITIAWRTHRPFIALLGFVMGGYLMLGREFAYLGFHPLYIGEVLFAVGMTTFLVRGRWRDVLRQPVVWLILVFALVGAMGTFPQLGSWGVDALRDGVTWGYALFAVAVAGVLIGDGGLDRLVRAYGRGVPFFLCLHAFFLLMRLVTGDAEIPGTNFDLPSAKPGDLAVHLVALFGFFFLAVDYRERRLGFLIWPVFGLATLLITGYTRGGLLAIIVGCIVLLLHGRWYRWLPFFALAIWGFALLAASGKEFETRSGRTISATGLITNVASIFGSSDELGLDGTKAWRLTWWEHIVDDTVFGPRFWTGAGYGPNIAEEVGHHRDTSGPDLRSPHSILMTVLARSGVPGALIWLLLQGVFVLSMLRLYWRSRTRGALADPVARLSLWVLLFWSASMFNALFDVYHEGPQGGLWFWAVVGVGLTVLHPVGRARYVEAMTGGLEPGGPAPLLDELAPGSTTRV